MNITISTSSYIYHCRSEKHKQSLLESCETNLENIKGLDESRAGVLKVLRVEKSAVEQALQEQKEKNEKLEEEISEVSTDLNLFPFKYQLLIKIYNS